MSEGSADQHIRGFLKKHNFTELEVNMLVNNTELVRYNSGDGIVCMKNRVDKVVFMIEGISHYEHIKPDGKDHLIRLSYHSRDPVNIAGSYSVISNQDRFPYTVSVRQPSLGFELYIDNLKKIEEALISKGDNTAYELFNRKFMGMLQANSTASIIEVSMKLGRLIEDRSNIVREFVVILSILVIYMVFFRIEENLMHVTPKMNLIMHVVYTLSFAFLCVIMIVRNKRKFINYGVSTVNLKESLMHGLKYAWPFILLSTVIKYLLTITPGTIYFGDSIVAYEKLLIPFFWVDMMMYSFLCYVQEFVTRGCLQSILERILSFLDLSVFWAILGANVLFAMLHLHHSFLFAIGAFFFGLMWGYIYHINRNLAGVSLNHMVVSFYPLVFLNVEKALYSGSIFIS
ncbi:MAG TPA: type II CAAX endopeptidase family protein [Gammaproteobacteria bacterium]|nr:type II CAAX endopeptidase family protein [Gammaproteobacteria bacterium]